MPADPLPRQDFAGAPATPASRPPATVVVCTRERPGFLADCVASLDAALDAGDELVVVEDGDSQAAAALAEVTSSWRHLRCPGRTKAGNMNAGLTAARREVVVFTDDDCRVQTGWVAGMARPFADPAVGVAFGPVRGLTGVAAGPPHPVVAPGPAPVELWNYAHGAAMAVRASAVVEVGGLDERLGPGAVAHGEEADLVLRLAARGWSCVVADAPPVAHLEWRDEEQTLRNLMVYERGSGAWLGAALRRDPTRGLKVLALRLLYQVALWRHPADRGWWFGPRTSVAFLRGMARGLTFEPRRWM